MRTTHVHLVWPLSFQQRHYYSLPGRDGVVSSRWILWRGIRCHQIQTTQYALWNKWILRCTTFVISHILGSYECFFYELTQFRSTFQTPTWGRGRHFEVFLQNQQIFICNFPQKAPRKLSQHEQMLISPGKCPCPSTEKWSLNLHC